MDRPVITIQTNDGQYTPLVTEEITLEFRRAGAPGQLTFQVVNDSVISFAEGDNVTVSFGAEILFTGFVFTKRRRSDGVITVMAYDQMRYLKNRDTYTYEYLTARELTNRIAADWGLRTGEIEETGYLIPARVENNRPLLDILQTAIDLTVAQTGHLFVLYDKAGALCLTHAQNMKLDTLIHEGSIRDFDYTSTIDRDAYSAVRLYRPQSGEGETIFYGARRDDLVARWGMLRHVSRLEEEADGPESAEALLRFYGRKTRRLRVFDAMGDIRVRGGSMLPVQLYLGDMNLRDFLMVERVTHRLSENGHKMELILVGGEFLD